MSSSTQASMASPCAWCAPCISPKNTEKYDFQNPTTRTARRPANQKTALFAYGIDRPSLGRIIVESIPLLRPREVFCRGLAAARDATGAGAAAEFGFPALPERERAVVRDFHDNPHRRRNNRTCREESLKMGNVSARSLILGGIIRQRPACRCDPSRRSIPIGGIALARQSA